jgi:hypothetical protein
MKKRAGVVAVFLCIAAALYFLFAEKKTALPVVVPPVQNSSAGQAGNSPHVALVSSSNQAANAQSLNPPQTGSPSTNLAAQAGQFVPDSNLPPETVLQNIHRAIHQYGEMFGGNPVGTNPEITSQLSGNNPKHINFITAQAGMRVNTDGELVDEWGTPYFFHQISGSDTEIHSAGPDKIMWTSDDLVVK